MTRETIFLVQSFVDGKHGLNADPPIRCKSEEGARRTAKTLGETKAGAVAFTSSGDAELGDFDDEVAILCVLGRVPETFER